MTALWTRQAGETDAAYRAFCAYRDLGIDRSLNAAYSSTLTPPVEKRAPGFWAAWSSEHNWVARVSAYDDYIEAELRRVRERKRFQLEERRARFEFGHQPRLEALVDKMTETANVAMEAVILSCTPPAPPPPPDPLAKALGLNLDADGKEIEPPKPPSPINVKVNVSGLGRFIDSMRAAAQQAACGLVLVKDPATAPSNQVLRGAEIAWVKPQSDPDPDGQ
jgi:hypothetical protein